MTRDEAIHRAGELNDERAPGDEVHWLAREAQDGWGVVRVRAPGLGDNRPTGAHVESRPRPDAADPRPANVRNIPPYGSGI